MLFPHIKQFQKPKWGLELVSLPHFLHYFWTKIFVLLYSVNRPNFIACLSLLRGIYWAICVLKLFINQVATSYIFEINRNFLIKPFFVHDQKVKTENEIFLERKEISRWNKNHFSIIFKGVSSKEVKEFFGRRESDFNSILNFLTRNLQMYSHSQLFPKLETNWKLELLIVICCLLDSHFGSKALFHFQMQYSAEMYGRFYLTRNWWYFSC